MMYQRIVDVHAHYQPRVLNSFMARFGQSTEVPGAPWTDAPEHIEERLRLMSAAGVGLQVLSPGISHYFQEPSAASDAAQLINDSFGDLARRYPAQIGAYASLPLPHIDASLRELDRAMRLAGFLGVTLHCSILSESIAVAAFDPIFEEMNRRRSVLFLHPCRNGLCSALINDYKLGEAIGTSVEDSLAVLHMIVQHIPHRYPNIRIIVPHLGGLLPMLLERLDNQLPRVHPTLPEPPSVTAKRFWYDTVSHGSAAALRCACDAFGADRLLPGSDYPFMLFNHDYVRAFSYVESAALPSGGANRILRHNAAALFAVSSP